MIEVKYNDKFKGWSLWINGEENKDLIFKYKDDALDMKGQIEHCAKIAE